MRKMQFVGGGPCLEQDTKVCWLRVGELMAIAGGIWCSYWYF